MLCFLFFSFYLSSPESSCIHLFTIHTFVFSSIHCLQCFYYVCPPLTFSVLFLILLCFHLCSLSLVFFSTHTLMITLFSLVSCCLLFIFLPHHLLSFLCSLHMLFSSLFTPLLPSSPCVFPPPSTHTHSRTHTHSVFPSLLFHSPFCHRADALLLI